MINGNILCSELLQVTVVTLGRWSDCVGVRGSENPESTGRKCHLQKMHQKIYGLWW